MKTADVLTKIMKGSFVWSHFGLESMKICNHIKATWLRAQIILLYVLLCIALVVALSGCKCRERQEAPGQMDVGGTYILESINGSKLPFAPPHKGGAPVVTSGTFTITSDGTCTSRLMLELPLGKTGSREVNADFKRHGNRLDMKWHGAGRTVGVVEGGRFTMVNEGVTFVYRKQP